MDMNTYRLAARSNVGPSHLDSVCNRRRRLYCKAKSSSCRDNKEDARQAWIRLGETEVSDKSRDCTKYCMSSK